MKIRKYKKSDKKEVREFILKVLTEIFERTFIKDWENFEDYSVFYVAKEDNKIVGTIALKDMGNGIGRLKRMYVDKNYRGSGIGQQLYDKFEEFARGNGFKQISLTTHKTMMKPANRFYTRNGYTQLQEVNYNLFPELKSEDVVIEEVAAFEKKLK